ncbi:Uncharacterised protein [Neisseria meningitidis]|uniref:Uncharacterized protein n=1 Tax=Neisseria meningitidis TaxID=487 RepID=A0AB33U0T3_NEIME|nr:Uncharacterised protein [Neisseria meningitidis]CWM83143.1 Uncharacterised protein [Neisseria meningitidis]CWM84062.1 Uncharacterised protein [Neisseria meningitidis]CWN03072.1 Uncharacterised protein [Neisseria meningitidis]CWN08566.1 Uncharacterised protein [Neisseria meningitidis]
MLSAHSGIQLQKKDGTAVEKDNAVLKETILLTMIPNYLPTTSTRLYPSSNRMPPPLPFNPLHLQSN